MRSFDGTGESFDIFVVVLNIICFFHFVMAPILSGTECHCADSFGDLCGFVWIPSGNVVNGLCVISMYEQVSRRAV